MRKRKTAVAAPASISVTPQSPGLGQEATFSWTGADGGWLYVDDACRRLFISSGVGDGSFTDTMPCSGAATAKLLSRTSGTNPDDSARFDVLAETGYTVS